MSKQHLRSNALRALVTFLAVVFAIGVTAVGAEAKGGKPAPFTLVSVTPAPGTTVDSSAYGGAVDVVFSDIVMARAYTIIDDATGQNVGFDSVEPIDNQTGLALYAKSCDSTGACSYGFQPGTTYTVTLGGAKTPVISLSGAKLTASDVPGVTIKKGVISFTFTTAP